MMFCDGKICRDNENLSGCKVTRILAAEFIYLFDLKRYLIGVRCCILRLVRIYRGSWCNIRYPKGKDSPTRIRS